ncbi:hypothetical protein E2542_SST27502 [Spatholobus suberectus]|nr:hypothetical protein E2542_SST27502 [Spatholobus suberectus]
MALFPSLPQLQRLLAFLWDSESARRDYSDPHEPRSGPDHWATFRTWTLQRSCSGNMTRRSPFWSIARTRRA